MARKPWVVEMSNKNLGLDIDNYYFIATSLSYLRETFKRETSGSIYEQISLPDFGKAPKKDRIKSINAYFDSMEELAAEIFFLELVTRFEAKIFELSKNASGDAKEIIKKQYKKDQYRDAIDRFVKNNEDIRSLSGVEKILKGTIPEFLHNNLRLIIEYRDHLAHGKRLGKIPPESIFSFIEFAQDVLNEVLSSVRGK